MVEPTFAAEFPNDNPSLHLGTIWMCEGVCGPPEPHFPEPPLPPVVEAAGDEPEDDDAAEDEAAEPIEIVESIELEGPIEIVPAPLESGAVLLVHRLEESIGDAEEAEATDGLEEDEEQAAAAVSPEHDEQPVEEPARANENGTPLVSTPPPPLNDPFEAFLQTLSDVACDSGQTFAASEIAAALGGDPVLQAWRAILNGESEDFALCATPLDEWASSALARVLSAPHKAGQLRRELRARGVAAFGLIEAA